MTSIKNSGSDTGATLERFRGRRVWAATALMIMIFGGLELYLRPYLHHAAGARPHLPQAVAISTAILMLSMLGAVIWASFRLDDELGRRNIVISGFVAFTAYTSVSITWTLLWSGGMVGRPENVWLFWLAAGVFVGTNLWLRIRERFEI